jgi:hypothetical protein
MSLPVHQEATMMQLISQDHYGEFMDELAEMHRLRYRVFKQRLDWDVEASGDLEIDQFDALHPVYLLQRGRDGRVQGCVRLLPSTGPTMLREAFGTLLNGEPAPASPTIWESSRFALDLRHDAAAAVIGIAKATYELFIGMVEFGLRVASPPSSPSPISGWSAFCGGLPGLSNESESLTRSATPRRSRATSRSPMKPSPACAARVVSSDRFCGRRSRWPWPRSPLVTRKAGQFGEASPSARRLGDGGRRSASP